MSSKLIVAVTACALPMSTLPTGVVPVFAVQAFTILTPSRYRSHVPDTPTVPHSSMVCHPSPRATPEKSWVFEASDLTYRIPLALVKTFVIGPLPAVRSRNRVVALGSIAAAFTLTLMQIEG